MIGGKTRQRRQYSADQTGGIVDTIDRFQIRIEIESPIGGINICRTKLLKFRFAIVFHAARNLGKETAFMLIFKIFHVKKHPVLQFSFSAQLTGL